MPEGELDIPLANPQSDPDALDAVVREIVHRVTNAKQACILPRYLLRRYDCVAVARAMIEASGLPFFVGLQDKSVLSESHRYAGSHLGRLVEGDGGEEEVRPAQAGAVDLLRGTRRPGPAERRSMRIRRDRRRTLRGFVPCSSGLFRRADSDEDRWSRSPKRDWRGTRR